MINYSIIIPHFNRPLLLQKCIDSIPQRDDVEVIIIDDHSDQDKVDFEHFPGLDRKNTTCIFSDGTLGKGPGYARNVGLQKAQGTWVMFVDSDDYLLENISELMDSHVDATEDVIYFKCSKQNTNDGSIEGYEYINDAIEKALRGDEEELLYATPCPVAKFIKLDYLRKNRIKFEHVIGGDDILFSIELSKNTRNRKYENESYYCVVMAPDSLTRNTSWQPLYNFTKASCSAYRALKPIGKEKYAFVWIQSWWGFLWAKYKFRATLLVPHIITTVGITNGCRCIKKGLKRGSYNWAK